MEYFRARLTRPSGCLSATALKWFALIFMTLDHLAAYCLEIPLFAMNSELLRRIGRMAAPLFLYCVVESMRHTRNRKRFVLRLYCAAVLTGLCGLLVSTLFFDGNKSFGNTFHAFVWITGTILCIDGFISAWKDTKWNVCALWALGYTAVLAATMILEQPALRNGLPMTVSDIISSFAVSPLRAEYSVLFILLGVVWYFMKTKAPQCLALFVLCAAGFFGGWIGIHWLEFIQGYQWTMVGTIPLILLYNGARGKDWKWFFYLYYPLHMYLIAFINKYSFSF